MDVITSGGKSLGDGLGGDRLTAKWQSGKQQNVLVFQLSAVKRLMRDFQILQITWQKPLRVLIQYPFYVSRNVAAAVTAMPDTLFQQFDHMRYLSGSDGVAGIE